MQRRPAHDIPAMLTVEKLIGPQPGGNSFPFGETFVNEFDNPPFFNCIDQLVVDGFFADEMARLNGSNRNRPRGSANALLQRRGERPFKLLRSIVGRFIEWQSAIASKFGGQSDQSECFLRRKLCRRHEQAACDKIPLGLGIKLQRHTGIAQGL